MGGSIHATIKFMKLLQASVIFVKFHFVFHVWILCCTIHLSSSNEDESSGGEDEHEHDVLGEDEEEHKELCIQVKVGKEERPQPFLDK